MMLMNWGGVGSMLVGAWRGRGRAHDADELGRGGRGG
jgi:hypothetical protein